MMLPDAYLIAFVNRLLNIFVIASLSTNTYNSGRDKSRFSNRLCAVADSWNRLAVSFRSETISVRTKLRRYPSISVLRKSSNWLTSDRRRDTFLSINVSDLFSFSPILSDFRRRSSGFLIRVSGVRISWAMLMKKSILA